MDKSAPDPPDEQSQRHLRGSAHQELPVSLLHFPVRQGLDFGESLKCISYGCKSISIPSKMLYPQHICDYLTPLYRDLLWKDFACSTDFANVVIHGKPWSSAYSCENQWHCVNICFILNTLWSDIMTEKLLCVNRLRIVRNYTKKQHPHSSLISSLQKFFLSLCGITVYFSFYTSKAVFNLLFSF